MNPIDAEFMRKHFTIAHVSDKPRFSDADTLAMRSIIKRLGDAVLMAQCTPGRLEFCLQCITAAAIDLEELIEKDM